MNYKEYNDYELIYMVRENDDFSRDILYEKYIPIIKTIVNDFYSSYSHYGYEYDDFFQEAIISFEKALNAYSEDNKSIFFTFVIICIRRSLISFSRNISNENKNISDYNLVELKEDLFTSGDVIFDYLYSKEIEEIFKNVLINLPINVSVVLELKLNGFSYREISILLDIPISTVEYRSRVARKSLRKKLENYR